MVRKKFSKKIETAIENYLNILKKDKLPIKKVILFGSFAKGKQKRWSDVDICVVSSRFKNRDHAIKYLWGKKNQLPIDSRDTHDLEPLGFNPKDFVDEDPLVWEIKKTGKIIYQKN